MMIRELCWRQENYHVYVYLSSIPKRAIHNTDHDDTQLVKPKDSVAIDELKSGLSSELLR